MPTPIEIAAIGSFHLGGGAAQLAGLAPRRIVLTAGMQPRPFDPNGEYEAFQMYVQYVRLARPLARYPLLFWHGGGMSGVTWETTPDGREGWQAYFLRAGHDVYVSDAVERGRASWARFPEINPEPPIARPKHEAWELFRIGPAGSWATRAHFPGTQFPVGSFDQFAKQFVPRFLTSDAPTQAAYDALITKIGPCVLVTHSQGGNFGFNAALHAPGLVKAVIAIEPSGAPASGTDVAALAGVPHLFVWGDYIEGDPVWPRYRARVGEYRDALDAAGAMTTWLDLPRAGLAGNSHMPMMDRNSDAVAGLVQDWMGAHGLMR